MSIPQFEEIVEPNDQTEARSEHLEKLRELVGNVYPNKFVRSSISGSEDTISALIAYEPVAKLAAEMAAVKASLTEGERPPAEIKDAINAKLKEFGNVRIAGRLTTPPRGNFVHLTDGINKLQIYAKKATFALVKNDGNDTLDDENGWVAWQLIDHGDFVGVEGYLFVTNTGEVSVHVEKLQFLAKAMLPMPDKMHGIADAEIRQRQRYYDLIGSSLQVEHEGLTTREVFETRAKTISSMRRYLEDHGYIEVETPMLTPKATGAAAKPFKTHHNALDIDLYARIAPELYLKRLVVGGFEKVYELNRNFRNEGISYKHNPEFTMLEFYCAYMDVNGMMDFCEEMFRESVRKATGGLTVNYEGNEIDFGVFERLTMKSAVVRHVSRKYQLPDGAFDLGMLDELKDLYRIRGFITLLWHDFNKFINEAPNKEYVDSITNDPNFFLTMEQLERGVRVENRDSRWKHSELFADGTPDEASLIELGLEEDSLRQNVQFMFEKSTYPELEEDDRKVRMIVDLFEGFAEGKLIQPTFIIDYPKSISPLSKASPENQNIAERFELFINGMEVANGFSELNDPREQYDRFVDQMSERERGDEEAMILDEDYIRALSYGMPPAAGIGIGIDRLVMLLTNKHSIRDVILFPHMRPEKNTQEETE